MQFKVLRCTSCLAIGNRRRNRQPLHGLSIVHLGSSIQGCRLHTCCAVCVCGVVLQKKRLMAPLLHYCRNCRNCRTVGGTVGLSDDGLTGREHGHCRNPLSDCRNGTVRLSEVTVGLSEQCRNTVGVHCRTVGPRLRFTPRHRLLPRRPRGCRGCHISSVGRLHTTTTDTDRTEMV